MAGFPGLFWEATLNTSVLGKISAAGISGRWMASESPSQNPNDAADG